MDLFEFAVQKFDGATYEHDRDHDRLAGQLSRVRFLMMDGAWRTLAEIHKQTGGSLPSISARLRDLRKEKFGGYEVERRYLHDGLFEYRVLLPQAGRKAS